MTHADVTAAPCPAPPLTFAEETMASLLAEVPGIADDLPTFAAMLDAFEEADARVSAAEADTAALRRRAAFYVVPAGA